MLVVAAASAERLAAVDVREAPRVCTDVCCLLLLPPVDDGDGATDATAATILRALVDSARTSERVRVVCISWYGDLTRRLAVRVSRPAGRTVADADDDGGLHFGVIDRPGDRLNGVCTALMVLRERNVRLPMIVGGRGS